MQTGSNNIINNNKNNNKGYQVQICSMVRPESQMCKHIFNSKPEDELHQISLEEDHQLSVHQQSFFKQFDQNKTSHKGVDQIKAFKAFKAFKEQQISQWNQPQKVKSVKLVDSAKKKMSELICRKQNSIRVVETSQHYLQLESDQRFLSMTELCHRYTFINQHNSSNQSDHKQSPIKNNMKLQYPNKITLKLQDPSYFIMNRRRSISLNSNQNTKNSLKFPVLKSGEHTSLPKLKKINKSQQHRQRSVSLQELTAASTQESKLRYSKELLNQGGSKALKINWKVNKTPKYANDSNIMKPKPKVDKYFKLQKMQQQAESWLEKHLVMKSKK